MNTPNQLDKESFRRWLARQPDTRVFNYTNPHRCMFCAFGREELGWRDAWAGAYRFGPHPLDPIDSVTIPVPFANAAIDASRGGSDAHFTISQFRTELAKQLHRETL